MKSEHDLESTRVKQLREREKDKWAALAEFEALMARKEKIEQVIEQKRKKEQQKRYLEEQMQHHHQRDT